MKAGGSDMSQLVTLELPDPVFAAVKEAAEQVGTTPATFIVRRLSAEFNGKVRTPEELEEARRHFRSFCGSFHSGDPHAGDNERIDADLAREYGSTHDPE
jgi:hypothetical protein